MHVTSGSWKHFVEIVPTPKVMKTESPDAGRLLQLCRSLQPFAVGSALMMAAACSGSDSVAPKPATQVALRVLATDGVAGTPTTGVSQQIEKTVIPYQFALVTGYRDLEVRLDGNLVAASGTITMDRPHELTASAFPVAASSATPEMVAMRNVYSTASISATRSLVRQIGSAMLKGDTAYAERYRRAEAFVLEELGPDAYKRLETSLAGTSVLVAGDSVATSSAVHLELMSSIPTFPADTVVPTTVVFVNGVFNSSSSATNSARALINLLLQAGFDPSGTVQQAGSARQAASMRVFLHFNPMVSLQNPVAECVSALNWALTVANGVSSDGSRASLWLRVVALLDKIRRVTDACKNPSLLSTNARALDQYLSANASLLMPPDADERALVALIEQERSFAGGRNVWVIGHSQGAMIARTAVGITAAGAPNIGCIGTLAIGSPISNTLPWPRADIRDAIIQKGTVEGSADIVYNLLNLSADRTDGVPSGQTNDLDGDLRNDQAGWVLARRLQLHNFVDGYLNVAGHRSTLIAKVRQVYSGAGTACAGTLEGTVGDFATRLPLAGANVQPRIGTAPRGSTVVTNTEGRFKTAPLFPVLHDLVITAPGYDTVVLNQRLVPFRAPGIAQGSTILLGKGCPSPANCLMQGTYTVSYQLTGTIGSYSVACAFDSQLAVTQHDSTFAGVITTDRYQQGCENPSGGFVFWNEGSTSITAGVQRGRDIAFTHAAVPPWQMTGRTFQGGFTASETLWKVLNPAFVLRVELTATRLASSSNSSRSRRNNSTIGHAVSLGPQLGTRR